MPNLKDLPIGDSSPDMVHAVIEIPKGSRNKIEYDPELQVFKLNRVLYSAVHYPAAYGFIPSTHGGDGDPLDVLVLSEEPLATGIVLDVIPIGGLEITDQNGEDLKIVAVAAFDPNVNEMNDVSDIPRHRRTEIEQFFSTYKILERKKVTVGKWVSANAAKKAIKKANRDYTSHNGINLSAKSSRSA